MPAALPSRCLLLALALTSLSACPEPEEAPPEEVGPVYATEFTAVQLDPSSPAPLQLAVQACAGLKNRAIGGSI